MDKKLAFYENLMVNYYRTMNAEFSSKSPEFATLNGMSKLVYVFLLAWDPAMDVASDLTDAKLYLKKNYKKNTVKNLIKSIRSYFLQSYKNSPVDYILVGFKTKEVENYLNLKNATYNNFSYPNIFFMKIQNRGKIEKYRKFYNKFLDNVFPPNIEIEKKFRVLIKFCSEFCAFSEVYSTKASLQLGQINKKILVTNAGHWRNRAIAAMCTATDKDTYGFPHGNIHLTSYDKNHHIENDILPVCKKVFAYSHEHKKDWEKLCQTNSRLLLDTKVILLPTSKGTLGKKIIKKKKIKVLLCGYPYNLKYYPFLTNYNIQSVMGLEKLIYNRLKKLDYIKTISIKPHPSSIVANDIPETIQIQKDIYFEEAIKNYDLAVFSHFKSSTFGYCVENKIPFLVFRDPAVSVSESSLEKMRALGGVVDMEYHEGHFSFSETTLEQQLKEFRL